MGFRMRAELVLLAYAVVWGIVFLVTFLLTRSH